MMTTAAVCKLTAGLDLVLCLLGFFRSLLAALQIDDDRSR